LSICATCAESCPIRDQRCAEIRTSAARAEIRTPGAAGPSEPRRLGLPAELATPERLMTQGMTRGE